MINAILVVCIGNICRSPMAEAILKDRLNKIFPTISIRSAGIHALVNYPADPIAQDLMRERGLDISSHRATQLTSNFVQNANLILAMTTEQKNQIEHTFPHSKGKIQRLGRWSEFDVIDPYKRGRAIFEHSLKLIEHGIDDWCKLTFKSPLLEPSPTEK